MIKKQLSRDELAEVLRKTGIAQKRPDITASVLRGASGYEINGVQYTLRGSPLAPHEVTRDVPTAAPTEVSDEEVEHRIAAIEARRKVAPAAHPAPAPMPAPVTETRAPEPAPTHAGNGNGNGNADLASVAMRGVNSDDNSIDYLFRDPGVRAAERSAATPDTSAGAQIVELAMRAVNDGSPATEHASRSPSGDLVRLAFQNIPDFDGPEAA